MSVTIIKKSQGIKRKISDSYQVINFLTKDSSKNLSVAIGEATNHSETTLNVKSERIYYVLEGKLTVKSDGQTFVAEHGDLIFIPKNTKYHFEGTFKVILINSPAFNPQDERTSEL